MSFVGIDLGTSKACVAVCHNQEVDVIENEHGKRSTPCYVGFAEDQIHIGERARHKATLNLQNTLYQSKRLIGRTIDDERVVKNIKMWEFDVVKSKNVPVVKVALGSGQVEFRAEEITAMIVRKMKEIAEKFLGREVAEAVISVPATFNDAQRRATRDAGKIAGFKNITLLNDPTAAAIEYSLTTEIKTPHTIMVFDLGAGSFNVSVCKLTNSSIQVIGSRGSTNVGGDNLCNSMVNHFIEEIQQKNGKDISKNKKSRSRLRFECEKAKHILSTANQAVVEVDFLDEDGEFRSTITQEQFFIINKKYFKFIEATVIDVIEDARMKINEIKQIVLVGGSSRIPRVQKLLISLFGEGKLNRTINADEAVARGAAVFAEQIGGRRETKYQQLLVKDVILRALSIEKKTVVKRNSQIPLQEKVMCTVKSVEVYEATVKRETLLGTYKMSKLSNINLNVDDSGILTVTTARGKSEICADSPLKLTSDQICDMIKKAEELRNKNKIWLEKSSTGNDIEKITYNIKQKCMEHKEKLSQEQQTSLLQKCDETLVWLENNKTATLEDYQKIKEKMENEWVLTEQATGQNLETILHREGKRHDARYAFLATIREEKKRCSNNYSILDYCKKAERWVDKNANAEKEEFDKQTRLFTDIINNFSSTEASASDAMVPKYDSYHEDGRLVEQQRSSTSAPQNENKGKGFVTQTQAGASSALNRRAEDSSDKRQRPSTSGSQNTKMGQGFVNTSASASNALVPLNSPSYHGGSRIDEKQKPTMPSSQNDEKKVFDEQTRLSLDNYNSCNFSNTQASASNAMIMYGPYHEDGRIVKQQRSSTSAPRNGNKGQGFVTHTQVGASNELVPLNIPIDHRDSRIYEKQRVTMYSSQKTDFPDIEKQKNIEAYIRKYWRNIYPDVCRPTVKSGGLKDKFLKNIELLSYKTRHQIRGALIELQDYCNSILCRKDQYLYQVVEEYL